MAGNEDIIELYKEVILDHNKNPRNFHKMSNATCLHEGFNPLCGDRVLVYILLDESQKIIKDVSFTGEGCAISKSSTSMMTEALKGKTIEEAEQLFNEFHKMLTGTKFDARKLGKLTIFSGVAKFPSRIKCAALGWYTMNSALEGSSKSFK